MTQPAPPLPRPPSDLYRLRLRAMVGPQTDVACFCDALTGARVRLVRYPSPNILGLPR